MNHDQIFRAILLAAFLGILPIGVYHRFQSQSTREPLDRQQEGLFVLATLRPLGAAFWLGTFVWLADPDWMAWSSVPLPLWLRSIGVAALAAGCGLTLLTFRSLGPNLTDTVVTRRKHTLVTHGPYKWVRHPLYVSAALLIVAISLMAANWFFFATGLLLFVVLVIRTRVEEENLVARFGESYRSYMERTGRFLPRMKPDRTQ
jgi:protein-S-isoprenylcysteine O-methyltransferase Ste14